MVLRKIELVLAAEPFLNTQPVRRLHFNQRVKLNTLVKIECSERTVCRLGFEVQLPDVGQCNVRVKNRSHFNTRV